MKETLSLLVTKRVPWFWRSGVFVTDDVVCCWGWEDGFTEAEADVWVSSCASETLTSAKYIHYTCPRWPHVNTHTSLRDARFNSESLNWGGCFNESFVMSPSMSHFRKVATIKLILFLVSREILSFLSFWDCSFWNKTQPIEHRHHQSES